MPSPFLYFPGDKLSGSELAAARLDGHLVELGEGYIPADAVETTELRAGSLFPLARDKLVVARWSAAWVYGALEFPPSRHSFARTAGQRITDPTHRRIVFHDIPVHTRDLVRICGVLVCSPVRTIADLTRLDDAASGKPVGPVVRALFTAGWARPDDVLAWIRDQRRLPGIRRATRLLTSLAREQLSSAGRDWVRGQPDVTR